LARRDGVEFHTGGAWVKNLGVSVSGLSVSLHLRKRGLSYQKPCYRDVARDEGEIERFVNDTFPRLHRLADKIGADIGFEDATGIGLMRRSGRTWGQAGSTPVVQVVMPRAAIEQVGNEVTKITNLESNRSKTNGISKSVCIPHCVPYNDRANGSDPFSNCQTPYNTPR
jgi:hypothetical protein